MKAYMQFGVADRMRGWATCMQAVHDVGLVVPRIDAPVRPAAGRKMDAAADLYTAQAYQLRFLLDPEDGPTLAGHGSVGKPPYKNCLPPRHSYTRASGGSLGTVYLERAMALPAIMGKSYRAQGVVGSSAFVILMAKPTAGKGSSVFL